MSAANLVTKKDLLPIMRCSNDIGQLALNTAKNYEAQLCDYKEQLRQSKELLIECKHSLDQTTEALMQVLASLPRS